MVLSLALVLPFRWLPPPISSVMAQEWVTAVAEGRDAFSAPPRWTDWDDIPSQLPLAVIASEDQRFIVHNGFDLKSIAEAIEERLDGGRMRGASTITQQVAKNLYLWQGRSFLRKGLEAYFTVLLEAAWPKRRIIEVYLNIAEFGRGVYGVDAAARHLFNKPPRSLKPWESCRLAAVLPNPKRMNAASPSPYVRSRAVWIQRQIRLMGGAQILERLGAE
jgi:monofunctional biosynthetic peptidoglycan transglycosylase